jgi:hypothetical protein
MDIWYILWQFGVFFPFWDIAPRKIWQPWITDCTREKDKLFSYFYTTGPSSSAGTEMSFSDIF